jgi:hypothetical protein
MKYGKYNVVDELKKATRGKKTAVPVGILLHQATKGHPDIQRHIARAFSITGDGCLRS